MIDAQIKTLYFKYPDNLETDLNNEHGTTTNNANNITTESE
jgi:hypothetical protein